jgi:hypothetical protein
LPDYAAIHSHVLHDVLARLDKTDQAFFRRLATGEKAGFPRFKGWNRHHSVMSKDYGNGATFANGALLRSKIGRIAVHWSRRLRARPRPSRSRKRRMGATSPSPVLRCPSTRSCPQDRGPASTWAWSGIFCHAGRRHADSQPTLLPDGRNLPAALCSAGRLPQARQPPAQEGCPTRKH